MLFYIPYKCLNLYKSLYQKEKKNVIKTDNSFLASWHVVARLPFGFEYDQSESCIFVSYNVNCLSSPVHILISTNLHLKFVVLRMLCGMLYVENTVKEMSFK